MIYIGIDTGVHTGLGVWNSEKRAILEVSTLTITQAMERVKELATTAEIVLYIEDARQRKWFGSSGREKLQGAGSVKRDSAIWESFCKEQGYAYHLIPPRANATKMSTAMFRTVTGWRERCSVHGRDALMLVFGR